MGYSKQVIPHVFRQKDMPLSLVPKGMLRVDLTSKPCGETRFFSAGNPRLRKNHQPPDREHVLSSCDRTAAARKELPGRHGGTGLAIHPSRLSPAISSSQGRTREKRPQKPPTQPQPQPSKATGSFLHHPPTPPTC